MLKQEINTKSSPLSQCIDDRKLTLNQSLNVCGGGGKSVKQIYKGDTEPTDKNILIWIDTSTSPIMGTQLITSDNKNFITSDNKAFILSEITPNALLTKDNKEFIEANNKKFILREEN